MFKQKTIYKMKIRTKLIIRSRLKVLKRTVSELVDGSYSPHKSLFNSYDEVIKTIEDGIDKQYLKKITFVGKNKSKIINRLEFDINWEKHRILCESPEGTYEFDGGKSISDQVSKVLPLLSTFIRNAIRSEKVNKISVHYRMRVDIDHGEASKDLGLKDLSEVEQKELDEFNKASFAIKVSPEKLDELTVNFQSKTKIKFDES